MGKGKLQVRITSRGDGITQPMVGGPANSVGSRHAPVWQAVIHMASRSLMEALHLQMCRTFALRTPERSCEQHRLVPSPKFQLSNKPPSFEKPQPKETLLPRQRLVEQCLPLHGTQTDFDFSY